MSRNGDLVADCWIEILLKKAAGNSYYPAEGIIQDLEVELGGQRIDKYNHSFARCYNEMMRQTSQEKNAYRRCTDWVDGEAVGNIKRFYVPLLFWFNRNVGNAVPLVALQVSLAYACMCACLTHR